VVVLGPALQRGVDVIRDVTDQDVRHAYIMLAAKRHGKKKDVTVGDRSAPRRNPKAVADAITTFTATLPPHPRQHDTLNRPGVSGDLAV